MAKILVIEDDKLMQEALTGVLESIGHTVHCESDGSVGFENFKQNQYDLVITDLRMTPIDGLTVIREIKSINPDMPVIMITGYPTVETSVEAIKSGATDFITKPFEISMVEVAIRQALEKKGQGGSSGIKVLGGPARPSGPRLEDFKASLIKEQRKLHTRFLIIFIILACIALGILLVAKMP
ncbi:MAG: response regulator [Verrucomicrobiae bacterium]|nr:response regulator [Verrucomicrobiae bacterium]